MCIYTTNIVDPVEEYCIFYDNLFQYTIFNIRLKFREVLEDTSITIPLNNIYKFAYDEFDNNFFDKLNKCYTNINDTDSIIVTNNVNLIHYQDIIYDKNLIFKLTNYELDKEYFTETVIIKQTLQSLDKLSIFRALAIPLTITNNAKQIFHISNNSTEEIIQDLTRYIDLDKLNLLIKNYTKISQEVEVIDFITGQNTKSYPITYIDI
jgi:hypothetical protein